VAQVSRLSRTGWAALALTVPAVLLLACGRPDESGAGSASDPETLGQRIYATNCASCHGARGEGQPNWRSRRPDGTLPAPPHDSSGHTWHHTDAVLIDIVARGGQAVYGTSEFTSGMPAFGDRLTSEEIAAVLSHIKSLWGEAERAYQEALR
jgi:mono/diheme cytochrome c family protein